MVTDNVTVRVSICESNEGWATYNMASCSHRGFTTSSMELSRGSELWPLLLLCRLFIGMAIGRPISLSVRFICIAGRPLVPSCRGPSEMYSAHWNWHTTYGSTLGRRPRPSDIVTASFPLGGPTTGSVLLSLDLSDTFEVRERLDGLGLLSCERVRGVWGGVAWFCGGA